MKQYSSLDDQTEHLLTIVREVFYWRSKSGCDKMTYCHTPAKLRPKPSWVGCIIGFHKTPNPKTQSVHISTTSTVPSKQIFGMQLI